MNRLWSRLGVRAASVGLLAAGVVGGVHLGQHRAAPRQDTAAQLVVQADAEELQLLKSRQGEHAAARAWQRRAESDAASRAAAEARDAAGKAHELAAKAAARSAAARAAANRSKAGAGNGALVPYNGHIPTSCQEFSGNRATGCALMLADGFAIDQFPCLNKLWNKESGWNARAANAGSGAYGIPQALPGSKMSSIAADWRTNPATQIKWGLSYIKRKYGKPCTAWSHSESTGSY